MSAALPTFPALLTSVRGALSGRSDQHRRVVVVGWLTALSRGDEARRPRVSVSDRQLHDWEAQARAIARRSAPGQCPVCLLVGPLSPAGGGVELCGKCAEGAALHADHQDVVAELEREGWSRGLLAELSDEKPAQVCEVVSLDAWRASRVRKARGPR